MRPAALVPLFALALGVAPSALAQARRVEVRFTPTVRAQIAVWIERADGTLFETVRLTDAVAFRGIGNRPGALQMNSGYHWPYGRREGVLPVWAHRRHELTGALFPRVVFAGRASEGNASSAGSRGEVVNTRDNYYCLSFRDGDESLDAVTCASVFMSNKGRYLNEADVAAGYGEPWEDGPDGMSGTRALELGSLYPPRQDLGYCDGCADHRDVRRYRSDTLAVMPEIDAVTMATPPGEVPFEAVFEVPDAWPDGRYTLRVEVNTEGDHAPGWSPTEYPTPRAPTGQWDSWAMTNGYPYRGQPSVVYDVPFELGPEGGEWSTAQAAGWGDLQGLDGTVHAMDGSVRDDAALHPGSGADRLREGPDGTRVRVVVPTGDPCEAPDAPADCGLECGPSRGCAMPLVCGALGACVGRCEVAQAPEAPSRIVVSEHPEMRHAHAWAQLEFEAPGSPRGVTRYEVRVGTAPIVDEASFLAARPAKAATLEDEALVVPVEAAAGDVVQLELGGLSPQTRFWVGVRAIDDCNVEGPIAVAEFETPEIRFTTVSPCFVATAAYGSPLDGRIGALRRLRDRHLRTNPLGRAAVEVYGWVGPRLAGWIGRDESRRAWARWMLTPWVSLAARLAGG